MWGCGRALAPLHCRRPLGPLASRALWRRYHRGGAGWGGRHERSGIHHVLRVPHARSVAPAPHVRPTTLVTTSAARPPPSAAAPTAPQRGVRDPVGPEAWAAVRPGARGPGRRPRVSFARGACAEVTPSLCPCAWSDLSVGPRWPFMTADTFERLPCVGRVSACVPSVSSFPSSC